MSKSIQELDPNFRAPVIEDGLAWHSITNTDVEGLGWPEESDVFCRLPNRAKCLIPEPVWNLSQWSPGVAVHFFTDAPSISARWSLRNENLAMNHMPASGVSGVDLYARDGAQWRWCGTGRPAEFPTTTGLLLQDVMPGEREYLLYLPLYNGTTELSIGVPESANLKIEKRAQKPICFYGTSIVHGGCAARTGMSYPAIIGRALDRPHINLGFSGNGRSESEVAQLLAELDPAVYVLDPLPNMTPELIRERIEPFVHTLRAARPSTPIVLVENITYQAEWIKREEVRPSQAKNVALREAYANLQKAEVANLHYVGGKDLLGDDGEGTVDGVHPTDVGFMQMARVLAPVIKPLLSDE